MTQQIERPNREKNTFIVDDVIILVVHWEKIVKNISDKKPNNMPTKIRDTSRILVDFFMNYIFLRYRYLICIV